MYFIIFAGFPATTQLSGTSFTTTLPAPTTTLLPTCTFPMMVTFTPKVTLSPMIGLFRCIHQFCFQELSDGGMKSSYQLTLH